MVSMESLESLVKFAEGIDEVMKANMEMVAAFIDKPNKVDVAQTHVIETFETTLQEYELQLETINNHWSKNNCRRLGEIMNTTRAAMEFLSRPPVEICETDNENNPDLALSTMSKTNRHRAPNNPPCSEVVRNGNQVDGNSAHMTPASCVSERFLPPQYSTAIKKSAGKSKSAVRLPVRQTPDCFRSESCNVAFTPRLFPTGPGIFSQPRHESDRDLNSKAKSLRF